MVMVMGAVARRGAFVAPPATVSYWDIGHRATAARVGDAVLVQTPHNKLSAAIRFGERLWVTSDEKAYSWCNHVMIVVDVTATGITVQQMSGGGGVLTPLVDFDDCRYAIVSPIIGTAMQQTIARAAAMYYVNLPYGWASIASDALYCLVRFPFALTIGQSVVCSADAVGAHRAFGLIPDKADIAVMPSDFARYYKVRGLAHWH